MTTMTSAPAEADAFVCTNPTCGESNPPVLIQHKGVRVCFRCGMPQGSLIHTSALSPLTRADRCDRCAAQAYGRATLLDGGSLLFCGHHLGKHFPSLIRTAIRIEDYRQALYKEEAGGLTAV